MRPGRNPWVGMIPWRKAGQPTAVFLPGESHGQRSLVGYSPWGHKESDTTERLSRHNTVFRGPFSAGDTWVLLKEGRGRPKCSCLPRGVHTEGAIDAKALEREFAWPCSGATEGASVAGAQRRERMVGNKDPAKAGCCVLRSLGSKRAPFSCMKERSVNMITGISAVTSICFCYYFIPLSR